MCKVVVTWSCYSIAALALMSCSPKAPIPIVERDVVSSRVEIEKLGGRLIRIVQSGDTLYSISFANGLNVNELAAWNKITDTSRLNVGQRIRLTKPIGFRQAVPVKVERVTPKPNLKIRKSSSASVASTPANKFSSVKVSSKVKTRVVRPASNSKPKTNDDSWSWPVKGRVIERYSIAKGQQGIAIEGAEHSQVRVTKAGEVVYVGDGLKGYGNLIIVKHSEHYLSAYAHNFVTYVAEGQQISAQHLIGLIGRDNKRRHALHFQIRKDGKPIDPLNFLPAG